MQMKNISILLNDQWLDISNGVDTKKNIVTQKRCDEAFASGNFIAWLDVPLNIPPYTLLKIDDEMYLCSSEGNRYLTTDKWVHEIQVVELTAILECFILGSKSFSTTGTNIYDYQKLNVIRDLILQKYGYALIMPEDKSSIFNEKHFFSFDAGQTVFSILTEIAAKYNYRPRVDLVDGTLIYISFVNLENNTEYPIDQKKILSIKVSQNGNQYCKLLESEMSNVVDRNTFSVAKGLTVRCEEVEISFESGKIFLPTRIESIKKLSISAGMEISFLEIEGFFLESYRYGYSAETGWSYRGLPEESMCLDDWFHEIKKEGTSVVDGPIYRLYQKLLESYPYLDEEQIRYTCKWRLVQSGGLYTNSEGNLDWKFNLEWDSSNEAGTMKDITSIILEQSEYNLLETKDKPRYCYYTTGNNAIEGLGVVYKTDLWNTLLGNSTSSCLSYLGSMTSETQSYPDTQSISRMTVKIGVNSADPRDNIFDVEYYGIANPIMIDEKNTLDSNENSTKKFTRTYDVSADMVDFDLLTSSMKKVNEMYGRIEVMIEYDVTNIEKPDVTQKVIFDNATYYITTIVYTHTLTKCYATLYLSKSYYKVAEAIGVKTQFNATKNPLNAIIERPIHFKSNEEVSIPSDAFVRIRTYKRNGTLIATLYKRFLTLKSNECVCCYTEAIDQFAFDYISKKADAISKYYISELVSYVDTNNEFYDMEIAIVNLPKTIGKEESRELPLYDGEVEELLTLPRQIVYKDSRERLTFTILLPNATLV